MTLAIQDNNIALLANYRSRQPSNSRQSAYAANFDYFEQGNPNRARLETFISDVFKKYYNAEIDQFYPTLLSIETDKDNHNNLNSEQSIKAVAGVRCAAEQMLFSEYYLPEKLETELQLQYGQSISRQVVVEVGNLAPATVGQMRWLIASITGFLYSAGFQYIVFTAVPGVYNAFKRMDMPLKVLTEAKQECLPEAIQHKWGPEYYQSKPVVLSGDIVEGFDIMKKSIYNSNKKLIPLFENACQLGKQFREIKSQLKGNVA
ncbi:MAG: thermostable hemolysin [Gammaproteobacteria bacterium]|nr:thermostable hemolysin [Gammaproteobacteria bacterium]